MAPTTKTLFPKYLPISGVRKMRALNFGFEGYGPEHFLREMESDLLIR